MKDIKSFVLRNRKLLIATVLLAIAVCYFLGQTFINFFHNKVEYKRLTRKSAQLDKEHEALLKRLELLHAQDKAYVERMARVKYHMSAPGETEFRFPKE